MSDDNLLSHHKYDMKKLSRTRAKDPVQEHLRQDKADWNADIRALLQLIRSLKTGVNGHPVPTIGLPKGKITEPLPPTLETLHRQVNDRFQDASSLNEGLSDIVRTANISREPSNSGAVRVNV